MHKQPGPRGRAIFITGASSGIGAALAEAYAEPGVVLGLAARRTDRLQAVARRCRKQGASVHCYTLDVRSAEGARVVAAKFLAVAGRIDLVVANAGIGSWRHPVGARAEDLTALIDTNVNGVINAVGAFVPALAEQRSGQIVALSSVAGFRGLPGGVYSASKAAVRYLMDGWRIDLRPYGIAVTTVYPGYIASEMTAGAGTWYPFLISSDEAAALIRQAVDAKQRTLVLPWQWWLVLPLLKLVPGRAIGWLIRRRRNDHGAVH